MYCRYIFLLFSFFCLINLRAQSPDPNFTLSGTVYESGSMESIPGAVIVNVAEGVGTASNAFGFYSITLPAGQHKILCSYVGYQEQYIDINLTGNVVRDFYLPRSTELETVVINAEKKERISEESRMSTIDIPVDQIKNIPALLGEKDVLKVVQLLPGVQKGSEGSTGFYVRGGGPDQNLIILDDAPVYNVNHLFGFFSLFNGDAIKSVELTKGGFPARYGGRLSSVLEMRMKDGNKEKLTGEVGVGIISSRFTLEGPVKKGKSSFLLSGRRTYIDILLQPFILSASEGDGTGGYYFYDFNAKFHQILDDKNKLYVSGYFGKDRFYVRELGGDGDVSKGAFQWGNATGTVRWNHIHNDKVFSNTSLIFTNYQFGINFDTEEEEDDYYVRLRYRSGIRDFIAKYDLDFIPNTSHYIRVGASSTLHRFKPSAIVIRSSEEFNEENEAEKIFAVENGLYIEDDWSISRKLKMNLGVRLSHYHVLDTGYVRPEPRLAVRYMLGENLSAKASYASMNQYLMLLSNTGAGLPTDLWVPVTRNLVPQRSDQVAAGLARDIPKANLMVSLEGYYKWMRNTVAYRDGASFLELGEAASAEPLNWEKNVTSGKSWSYGAELFIQRKFGKLTGWIGYTLSWTKMQFDELNFGKEFFARYDRRHDASLVLVYKINERITLSGTWVYGTGQAISLPLASFDTYTHFPSFAGLTDDQFGGFISAEDYGEKNGFRMKPYHRMDLGVQFHKQKKTCTRTFELGLYNAYSRLNPYYYYIDRYYDFDTETVTTELKQISLFPVIPSVSWTYKW
ncbi:MAG: hypothetical protein RL220_818 [Bacteroidota bacterium]